MRIESIEFRNFRNYDELSLGGLGALTIFIGCNAVGKTNILEGVQLLTSASSFRHPQINQLIREGEVAARLGLTASDESRLVETTLFLEPGKRRYEVNGKAKNAVDVRGILPSVMFTPDDLQLAKKSSSFKRAALDDLGAQLTRNYYIVRRDYEKTLRYKNKLLKEEASRLLVESINETLVTCGSQLLCFRYALLRRVVSHLTDIYARLSGSGEDFRTSFKPSWERVAGGEALDPAKDAGFSRDEVRNAMIRSLDNLFEDERQRKRSLIGPHNDEVTFFLSGRDASNFASQGQQRSIVLAWKLAEVELIREVMGTSPVLLLDDVLSELDGMRREMLVRFVTDEIQTFVTATDLAGFHESLLERADVMELPLRKER